MAIDFRAGASVRRHKRDAGRFRRWQRKRRWKIKEQSRGGEAVRPLDAGHYLKRPGWSRGTAGQVQQKGS